ncbi:serine/threonine-protein kinase [Streptomyces yaizuensis]|uniref:non-specific serine/threonine protein kinase n=1 Tax=Streptomyces yaizuensis TaxID=2989713 RepID=A0ABQ5P574_9ACTN|nr:serine/threonine-protein kinase [Streptomyces sp. YSPA8]GLF97640.1 serine/threonine protein kinase [Streptomyces sp. YSPA8]
MENVQGTGAGLLLAGRYRLGESIGRGGMGRVWRAYDEVLNRVVAIKELTAVMYAAEADRTVMYTRTRNEARAAARISHPCVVTVHDVLDHDERPWIVMQYVDGPSLADAVKKSGRLPVADAARVGLQVVGALAAAHAAGVLHRDVKPANVLLGPDGRALITDFGIAAIEGDPTITRTGEIVGSIDYLPPERVRGSDPGPASDLWSLGATLYTAVEGESPFRRPSPLTTMQAVVTEDPRPLTHAGPLAPVIMALLDKDPARRPAAARAEELFRAISEGRTPDLTGLGTPAGFAPGAPGPLPDPLTGATAPLAGTVSPDAARTGTLLAGETTARPAAPAPRPRRGSRVGTVVAAAVLVLAALVGAGAWYAYESGGDEGTGRLNGAGDSLAPPENGKVVQDGQDGQNGQDGQSGQDGQDGQDGQSGQDGQDGRDGRGSTAEPQSPGASGAGTPTADGTAGGGVPAGWRRVQDPVGFSLLVPRGWTRTANGSQVDYTSPNGRQLLRIGIDSAPDFENPYLHLLDLERLLKPRLPAYQRLHLDTTDYRDQPKAARWEFIWTNPATKSAPGPRRAVDQMYFDDAGTEYAIYLEGPAEEWERTQERFGTVLRSWQPPR